MKYSLATFLVLVLAGVLAACATAPAPDVPPSPTKAADAPTTTAPTAAVKAAAPATAATAAYGQDWASVDGADGVVVMPPSCALGPLRPRRPPWR